MIYIKENNSYNKYHITNDGRLICTDKDGEESVILYDISGEFDAIVSDESNLHFVLQGLNGELIYLQRESGTWKKYNIFKSRRGLRRIYGIRLAISNGLLCAFYIMEYTGKNLMVKHVFSPSELYREPEVIDLADARKDFCICESECGETYLFFKDENGVRKNYIFDTDFKLKKAMPCSIDTEALTVRAEFIKNELVFVYTLPRKSSTTIAFCKADKTGDAKIITFGVSRNCIPQIIAAGEFTAVQWEENSAVMQALSNDGGDTFSKPKSPGAGCMLYHARHPENSEIKCDMCAMYNNYPYIPGTDFNQKHQNKGDARSMNYNQYKNDIVNESYCREILTKLKEIDDEISKMSKNLEDVCSFLDDLKDYALKDDIGQIAIAVDEDNKATLSGEDIGEIDEDNIKLFESTDIDEILPDTGK